MDMAGLAFFDECTERIEEENGINKNQDIFLFIKLKFYVIYGKIIFLVLFCLVILLELDESQHSERTVYIAPPEAGKTPIIYKLFKLNPDLMRPQKNFCLKNPSLSAFGMVPGSPMARRTKHEIKVAQRMARKQVSKSDFTAHNETYVYNFFYI